MSKCYDSLTGPELATLQQELEQKYADFKAKNLTLNMARGKPSQEQIEFSLPMLDILPSTAEIHPDYANYGMLDGIPEAKEFMGYLLGVSPSLVFIGGNSSLNMMHDCVSLGYSHGYLESEKPWAKEKEPVTFLCPVPGYDRHFAVAEHFGISLLPVSLTENGPDMDQVEELVKDPAVRGIWCVPKYSNPTGTTYSDETVRRLAALSPAAPDFKIFWDNAYSVHHLDMEQPAPLLNLMDELEKTGKENMAFLFASTSKLTFPGGGISAVASGKETMEWFNGHMALQTISYDKINQLRHARFLPTSTALLAHMEKHASSLAPKFEMVLEELSALDGLGVATWETPRGGYFISLDVMNGCAKRVVGLCKDAGVILTPAGATHPYGNDPNDSTIRIAPSFPPVEELQLAAQLLVLCTKLAAVEKLQQAK